MCQHQNTVFFFFHIAWTKNWILKEILRLFGSASKLKTLPMSDRAVDQCSSASTVEGTRCSRLCHLKLSIHNYMDCHQFYPSLHLFPAFTPSAVSFFHLTGQLLALYHLNVSLCCMLQTIFGNHKWPSQPRGAFVDSFPVCINIYQARKQRQMSTMRKCLLVTRL